MKSFQAIANPQILSNNSGWSFPKAMIAGLFLMLSWEVGARVALWDTVSRFGDTVEIENRSGWKAVPSDLFTLEANPPKAASDPGYYGRDYSFKGDAVVENRRVIAVFSATKGRVVIYAKADPTIQNAAGSNGKGFNKKIAELVPLRTAPGATTINHCEILRNSGDEIVLEVAFSSKGSSDASAIFTFGKTETVEVKPAENLKGISLVSPMEYGLVPGFIGDDLIFSQANFSGTDPINIPAEGIFLGLLKGEDNILVMTWPRGKQRTRLRLSNEEQGKRSIESLEFENDGQSLFLAALESPGIWHREELKPSYLEKDMPIQWKKPFSAKWKTQLDEAGVKTAFNFRDSKSQVWRGVPGSYSYPVWFDGDGAFYHLSKKVPPKGDSLIYFLEGNDTPDAVSTPVDIMKATLGWSGSEALLDSTGRKLRTHHRRGGDGVRRACTCGCTEAIQAVFEAGEETEKKEYIHEALDDMIYFVQRHVQRIDEYRRFAAEAIKYLQSQESASPELKPFLEGLEQIAQQIPQEYDVQKENMKSLAYADELVGKTMALTGKKDSQNLKAYMDLLKAWRGMGGSQDYVVAECHAVTRKLFQEAGYSCVNQPKAVEVAMEIRKRCKQTLRNPDGYEIWPDY